MNELEFRQRLYGSPREVEQELLDAAAADPALAQILNETQSFEDQLQAELGAVEVPSSLKKALLDIPASEASQDSANEANWFGYFALAASMVLAVGLTLMLANPGAPSAQALAMGDGVFQHLGHEEAEIAGIASGQIAGAVPPGTTNQVLAATGGQLVSANLGGLAIVSAKPCKILPNFDSAHLMFQGESGTISVFIINNSPIDSAEKIRNERFHGTIIPAGKGNIILVGEQDENLERFQNLFADNVDWVI